MRPGWGAEGGGVGPGVPIAVCHPQGLPVDTVGPEQDSASHEDEEEEEEGEEEDTPDAGTGTWGGGSVGVPGTGLGSPAHLQPLPPP